MIRYGIKGYDVTQKVTVETPGEDADEMKDKGSTMM